MLNLNRLPIVLSLSLLALAGCNNGTEQANTISTSTSSPIATTSTESTAGYGTLLTVVAKTKTATEAGNFGDAKKEFGKFEASWGKVEDGIKSKSSKSYDAIEKSLDEVNSLLKESKPAKEKLITALKSLETNIQAAPKP
jgi:uncharacterized lipoprotein NlpE involved in copper resistance